MPRGTHLYQQQVRDAVSSLDDALLDPELAHVFDVLVSLIRATDEARKALGHDDDEAILRVGRYSVVATELFAAQVDPSIGRDDLRARLLARAAETANGMPAEWAILLGGFGQPVYLIATDDRAREVADLIEPGQIWINATTIGDEDWARIRQQVGLSQDILGLRRLGKQPNPELDGFASGLTGAESLREIHDKAVAAGLRAGPYTLTVRGMSTADRDAAERATAANKAWARAMRARVAETRGESRT